MPWCSVCPECGESFWYQESIPEDHYCYGEKPLTGSALDAFWARIIGENNVEKTEKNQVDNQD